MSSRQPEFDYFIHAFSSPLTALQGAAGLLQRRLQHADAATLELIATLESSVARLRVVTALLERYARVEQSSITIQLPREAFTQLAANHWGRDRDLAAKEVPLAALAKPAFYAQAYAPLVEKATVPTLQLRNLAVLCITNDPVVQATLIGELERMGGRITHTPSPVAGVDIARQLLPDLIVLDIDQQPQGKIVSQVLAGDPQTKHIPQIVLCQGNFTDFHPLHELVQCINRDRICAELFTTVQALLFASQRRVLPHILIVDDDEAIGRQIAMLLNETGYQTTMVTGGVAALNAVRRQSFSLIILDLLLPDLHGYDVLGALRAQSQTALTPVILLSALDTSMDKETGFTRGADDYMTKPFTNSELTVRVQAALRRSEAFGAANPSTQLPGNITIERAIAHWIDQGLPLAVCYADLDNFKAYNDTYGFMKGDAVIRQTAQVLVEALRTHGSTDDFVGHIGGDDFVLLTAPDRLVALCQYINASFDALAPLFYDPITRERGFIEGVDRAGTPMIYPLLSISLAAVTSSFKPFTHPAEASERAIEIKHWAKHIVGSSYVIES